MGRWMQVWWVSVGSVLALSGCVSEPLTADQQAFCAFTSEERLDVFDDDVFAMSPADFEAAQRSQTEAFVSALEVAPPELQDTIEWIIGQYAAINAVYDDIGWDLSRADEADPELLAVVANRFPESEADDRYREIEVWTRRC